MPRHSARPSHYIRILPLMAPRAKRVAHRALRQSRLDAPMASHTREVRCESPGGEGPEAGSNEASSAAYQLSDSLAHALQLRMSAWHATALAGFCGVDPTRMCCAVVDNGCRRRAASHPAGPAGGASAGGCQPGCAGHQARGQSGGQGCPDSGGHLCGESDSQARGATVARAGAAADCRG